MKDDIRIGYGEDIHRLEKGGNLILSGIKVSEEIHAVAHSDGDAVYHALADALLGAIGQNDIGHFFPVDDSAYDNLDSARIVEKAKNLTKEAGFAVINADLTILLERPKLAPYVKEMKKKTAALLEIIEDRLSIKCGTYECIGPIGEGRAVKAIALVLLGKER